MLSDYTTIELGEHDGYTLTAKAKKNSTGTKVQVQPSVVFRKLAEGGTEALSENTSFLFYTVRGPLKKDYFTEEDVFKYILDKTAGIAINTDPAVFASSFYAAAKTGVTPADLFTDAFKAQIKKYAELYRTKDTDEHLKLDIGYGIVQPQHGGLEADDYTGTVKAHFCIATNTQVQNQSGITAIKNGVESGFASIPDDAALAAKKHLFFHLIPKHYSLTLQDKADWEQKVFSNHPLLRVDENGHPTVDNPFGATSNPFNLSVSGSGVHPSSHLDCAIFGAFANIVLCIAVS